MESSNSVENYIKGIYALLAEDREWVNTNDLAARMQTKPSSVTDMVKRLAEKDLVHYQKYQGVQLTANGRLLALQVIRKHRLWEVFLQEKLGFNWDEVHDIAEQLEHISSPELVKRLDKFLGFPEYDPHGDPIPDDKGHIKKMKRMLLSDLIEGEVGKVVGVNDSSPAFLRFLESKNIRLGCGIKVIEKHEYDQSLDIVLTDTKQSMTLSKDVSSNLFLLK